MIMLDKEALDLLARYKEEAEIGSKTFVGAVTDDTMKSRKKCRRQWECESRAAVRLANYLAQFDYNTGGC